MSVKIEERVISYVAVTIRKVHRKVPTPKEENKVCMTLCIIIYVPTVHCTRIHMKTLIKQLAISTVAPVVSSYLG